jgi:hypothetical protein
MLQEGPLARLLEVFNFLIPNGHFKAENVRRKIVITPETYDHDGKPVQHQMARVNGIRLHYITAGTRPPLLLLHGTPKNHYYWYRLLPYLSPHFSIIAPDLRGFGATDKPPASEGYDGRTNAKDMAELMKQIGHTSL